MAAGKMSRLAAAILTLGLSLAVVGARRDLKMLKFILVAVLSAALVLLALPASAVGAADVTCQTKLRALQRQNLALRRQLQTVVAQRNTARTERDNARAQLTAAQNGVAGVIASMTPDHVWGLAGFPISRVLVAPPRYSTSYFSSGGNYESWTFTNCGFCVGISAVDGHDLGTSS